MQLPPALLCPTAVARASKIQSVKTLNSSLQPLEKEFAAAANQVRILLLTSPT